MHDTASEGHHSSVWSRPHFVTTSIEGEGEFCERFTDNDADIFAISVLLNMEEHIGVAFDPVWIPRLVYLILIEVNVAEKGLGSFINDFERMVDWAVFDMTEFVLLWQMLRREELVLERVFRVHSFHSVLRKKTTF